MRRVCMCLLSLDLHPTPQRRNLMHRHTTKGSLLGIALVLLATLTTVPDAAAAGDAVRVWNTNAGVAPRRPVSLPPSIHSTNRASTP